jgi:hypothetical protein
MFGEKYIFKHVGEKMLENMQEICKNNTDSNLDTKVSTCLEDNWLNKIQNFDKRDFVFQEQNPKTKLPLTFPKWTKIKMSKMDFYEIIFFFENKNFKIFNCFISAA